MILHAQSLGQPGIESVSTSARMLGDLVKPTKDYQGPLEHVGRHSGLFLVPSGYKILEGSGH